MRGGGDDATNPSTKKIDIHGMNSTENGNGKKRCKRTKRTRYNSVKSGMELDRCRSTDVARSTELKIREEEYTVYICRVKEQDNI